MRFVFQVPIHGNVLLLGLFSLPYLFVPLSIGILVSSKANSQSEAIQLAFLTFLPSIFFSGYIFPRETMPTIFYVISYFIPASYYINITRGIILRGAGLSHLWLDGLALYALSHPNFPPVPPPAGDPDRPPAIQASAQTYKTLSSGIIYEKPPDAPLPRELYAALITLISEIKKQQAERASSAGLKDAELFHLLVFLYRMGLLRTNARSRSRRFIAF